MARPARGRDPEHVFTPSVIPFQGGIEMEERIPQEHIASELKVIPGLSVFLNQGGSISIRLVSWNYDREVMEEELFAIDQELLPGLI